MFDPEVVHLIIVGRRLSSSGRRNDLPRYVDEIIVGAVEIKNSVIPSVALSPTSTNILYLKSANTG